MIPTFPKNTLLREEVVDRALLDPDPVSSVVKSIRNIPPSSSEHDGSSSGILKKFEKLLKKIISFLKNQINK